MPAYAFPNRQSYDKMARVVKLRDGREGGLRSNKIVPRDGTPRLGKVTTAAIPADGSGEVTVLKNDETETNSVIDSVANDADKEWAVGDLVYIMWITGSWRIIGPVGGGGGTEETEGFLTAALTAPVLGTDAPTDNSAEIYERTGMDDALVATSTTVADIKNSDPDLTAPSGAYCRWKSIGGVKQFTYVGCEDALS